MKKHRIKQLFIEVASKAKQAIETKAIQRPVPGLVTTSLLVRSGLIFEEDVADSFFQNVDEAAEIAKANPAWSKSSIDRIFSEGIASISDGQSVAEAANELASKLDVVPTNYKFRFSLFSLNADCAEVEFGLIKTGSTSTTPNIDLGPYLKAGVQTTYHHVEVESAGVDLESAKARAIYIVDEHLSVLNIFCSDDIPSACYLSRTHTTETDLEFVQVLEGGDWQERVSSRRIRRPILAFEWKRMIEHSSVQKIGSLLARSDEFARNLTSALRLAGDATREGSEQSAFLLLAVALESALMCGKSATEISRQFALRAALLSSGNTKQRQALYEQVKRLYDLRSSIVHTGSASITRRDLTEMNQVCTGCLTVLSTAAEFDTFRSSKELDEWFLARLLEGPRPEPSGA